MFRYLRVALVISILLGTLELQARNLSTSVIIPCSCHHAHLLCDLIKLYEHQTVLPDEIIISLSESGTVDPSIIDALHNEPWKMPVHILLSEKVQYAGENRNICCKQAHGDIFILQDADDIPHPQRVEIIRYCFERYKIDHLMHEFRTIQSPQEVITPQMIADLQTLPVWFARNIEEVHNRNRYHNGNEAISRKIFEKFQWSKKRRGQDHDFNANVNFHFKKILVVDVPLIYYRQYLSTLNK